MEDIKGYVCSEGSFNDWKPSYLTAPGTSTPRSKRFTMLQVELENSFWGLKVCHSIVVLIIITQRYRKYSLHRQALEVMEVVGTTAHDTVTPLARIQNLLGR